jgi:adenylate cyclase
MAGTSGGFLHRVSGWLLGSSGAARRGYLLIPTAAAAILVLLFFFSPGLFHVLELKILDEHFRLRGRRPPAVPVQIVAIDDASLETVGRWPWPRTVLARLVAALGASGAKAIGLDIILSEPEQSPEGRLVEELLGTYRSLGVAKGGEAARRFEHELAARRERSDPDRALAAALQGAPLILAAYFDLGSVPATHPEPAIPFTKFGFIRTRGREDGAVRLLSAAKLTAPLPAFVAAAKGLGHVNIKPENDGTVRREALSIQYGGKYYASLALQTVRLWLGLPEDQMLLDLGSAVQLGDIRIPTDVEGRMPLNFAGPGRTFPHHSAADVLSGRAPAAAFKDAIVFVGATATAVFDLRVTPFEPIFPGVEIHATAAENILARRFLRRPAWVEILLVLLIAALPFLVARCLVLVRPLTGGVLALGALLGLFALGQALFAAGIWFPVFYPMLAVAATLVPITVHRALTEERQRLFLKRAFQQYVPERVVERVVADPTMLRFGGERRDLTILFSDIRSFTTYSEQHDAEQVVEVLREYLTRMVDAVFRQEGTLDKFIGDAVMAIFGAPVPQRDHALRACRTALDMMRELRRLQEKWKAEGRAPFEMGIGINTGEVIVGNLGSDQRFDYTVIGDPVNLAARMESLNKDFPQAGGILLSEYTYDLVKERVEARHLGEVAVKGKARPVGVYALIGLREVFP